MRAFIEHACLWGGIGVIAGAAAATVNMAILFAVGGAAIIVAVFLAPLFERMIWNVLASLGIAVMLLGIWKVTPKPKEPPTLDEISKSFKEQFKEANLGTAPASMPTGAPPTAAPPIKKPHKTPSASPPNSPPPTAPPTQQPPQNYAALTIVQGADISTRPDAPYKAHLSIQTTLEMPSLKLLVKCDGPLVEAQPHFAGSEALMMTGGGVVQADNTLISFFYGSATPPFGPSNPLLIDVWSAAPVKCNQARTF